MLDGLLLVRNIVLVCIMTLVSGFFHYLLGTTIAKKPFCYKAMVIHTVAMALEMLLSKLYYVWREENIGAIFALLVIAALSRWLYNTKGRSCLSLILRMMIGVFVMEMVSTLLVYLIVNGLGIPVESLFIVKLEDMLNIKILFWNTTITDIAAIAVTLGLMLWRSRKKSAATSLSLRMRKTIIYVRLVCTLLFAAAMLFFATSLMKQVIEAGLFVSLSSAYVALLIASCLFLVCCMSYFVQDVRYLHQLNRNETLEHQQAMIGSLLTSLRSFRHNTVNMLYGFEGAILSGDTGTIKSYYREMTEKCALVNNENIVALERIANPAVSALLLRAVERARQESLPIQLYVQNGLRIGKGLSDSDLCEVMGVLLDNAIEAASQAKVKLVTVEMRNIDNAMELIVKNTYAGTVTEAQLLNGATSTKPGHSGHGLQSVRDILARNRKAFLNLHVSSQYVSMQLFVNQ